MISQNIEEDTVIETRPAPCWRLVDANGVDYSDGDGIPHYDTQADAQAHAETLNEYIGRRPGKLTPKQYAEPCINVKCNGCGNTLDDGVWSNVHFETEAEARKGAEACDWATELGPNVWHEECVPAEIRATR